MHTQERIQHFGGGVLASCNTSTPINHTVFFFCRIPVVSENRRSPQGRGGCAPLHPPPRSAPAHCTRACMSWPWTGYSKDLLLEEWSARIFGGSWGPKGWRWYSTSVVACVVCLPSRVSSLKSLLSAANWTNGRAGGYVWWDDYSSLLAPCLHPSCPRCVYDFDITIWRAVRHSV